MREGQLVRSVPDSLTPRTVHRSLRGNSRQLEAVFPFEKLQLCLGLGAEAPQADETLRGFMIELITLVVRGQVFVVEAVFALPAHRLCGPFEEFDPDLARDESLVAGDKRGQILVESAEPQAVVDQVCIFLTHESLETQG